MKPIKLVKIWCRLARTLFGWKTRL